MCLRLLIFFSYAYLLASCSYSPNKHDEQFLTEGDSVKLVRPVTVQGLRSHVIFQDGAIVNEKDLAPYRTSCIFDVHELGPSTHQSKTFTLSKIEYYEEMYSDTAAVVRYFTEFYLAASELKRDWILTCQILDDTMQYHSFPLHEIKQATGNYFEF